MQLLKKYDRCEKNLRFLEEKKLTKEVKNIQYVSQKS